MDTLMEAEEAHDEWELERILKPYKDHPELLTNLL